PGEPGGGEAGTVRYQLMLGERPNGELAEFLHGHETAVLGSVGDRYYYDATVDSELALALLGVITSGAETANRVRPVSAEQSNTSLVYDDRLIAKVFRRLHDGPNPDVEVTEALARAGFSHVAAPIAAWRRGGTDLAFVQQYLVGGSEGWALALTSLRDLYSDRPADPADAGGDFGAEAGRLGRMTAEMHLALADAFGVETGALRSVGWPALLDSIEDRLRTVVGAGWSGAPAQLLERLRSVDDPGPALRVHGDYHLGQVMRTDSGWYVLDFEGEPARPIHERTVHTAAYKDVTGMLRSFHYAAYFALLEREDHEMAELSPLADAWEARNRAAFLDGYLDAPGIGVLLPERPDVRDSVALAFELDKALYELAYERAYRPGWIQIPSTAIQRLLTGSIRGQEG
ncbi:MAG: phosphotransferase, partial [Actinomycetota bacterium]|nr:phosphotransferase [Actinomycetota bacterium]